MLSRILKRIQRISDRTLLILLVVVFFIFTLQQLYIFLPGLIPLPEKAFINDEAHKIKTLQAVYCLQIWDKEENKLNEYATGSAFAAFDNGIFVTCSHCIKSTDDLYILLGEDEQETHYVVNRVLIQDEEHDLALIECKALKNIEPLHTNKEKLHIFQPVVLISSPGGNRNQITSGAIRICSAKWISTSSMGIPGSSGGPLFNIEGEVIGVIQAMQDKYLGKSLGNIYAPISYAEELYNKWLETESTEPEEDHYTITLPVGPQTEDNNFIFSIG